jgi:hypothetical protein
MADSNPIQPYDYPPSEANDFKRKGHPGRFHTSITCLNGSTTIFTGSNFGVGGVIVPTGAAGTAYLSNGGELALGSIAGSGIQELSVERIVVSSGTIYALKRNQTIR